MGMGGSAPRFQLFSCNFSSNCNAAWLTRSARFPGLLVRAAVKQVDDACSQRLVSPRVILDTG